MQTPCEMTTNLLSQKTLHSQRMTWAAAVAVMAKLGRLPVIARLGLVHEVITVADIEASKQLVIDPNDLEVTRDAAAWPTAD